MKGFTAWLSLFTSTGTLLCCALPSLLVALGMGATMAGLVTTFPQLIWLSQYKAYIFISSGVMLVLSAYLQYRARYEPCPIDPSQAQTCKKGRKYSMWILCVSCAVWLIGAFFAFVIVRL